MPNSSELEEEAMAAQEGRVNDSINAIQQALAANDITDCEECGGEIEAARKAAMPSAIHCIECMRFLDKRNAQRSKLIASPAQREFLSFGSS